MKLLYHPGTPCAETKFKNLEESILGENLEAVRNSDGFGVFGEKEYFLNEDEFSKLKEEKDIRIFDYPVPEGFGWGFTSPIDLTIELTRKCNQRCIHCWNESGKGSSLDYGRLREIIDEFRNRGGQAVKLVGGEPLCYDKFYSLLEFLKEKQIPRTEITTNGTLIKSEDVPNLSNYLSHVNLSLHGDNPSMQDSISGFKGSYKRATETLKKLRKEKIDTTIYFTYMLLNASSIPGVINLAEETDSKLKFSFLQNQGRAMDIRLPTRDEILRTSEIIMEKATKKGIKLERSGLVPMTYSVDLDKAKFYGCSGMRKSMYINSEGDIYPCELFDVPISNIYPSSLIDAWHNKNTYKFRNLINCEDKSSCKIECAGRCKAQMKEYFRKRLKIIYHKNKNL